MIGPPVGGGHLVRCSSVGASSDGVDSPEGGALDTYVRVEHRFSSGMMPFDERSWRPF